MEWLIFLVESTVRDLYSDPLKQVPGLVPVFPIAHPFLGFLCVAFSLPLVPMPPVFDADDGDFPLRVLTPLSIFPLLPAIHVVRHADNAFRDAFHDDMHDTDTRGATHLP